MKSCICFQERDESEERFSTVANSIIIVGYLLSHLISLVATSMSG